MKGELKRKSFEELTKVIGYDEEPKDLPEGQYISDEEVSLRVQIFINAWQEAENLHRKLLNNLSFAVNRKILEGCQGEELIEFYNSRVGAILDAFIIA